LLVVASANSQAKFTLNSPLATPSKSGEASVTMNRDVLRQSSVTPAVQENIDKQLNLWICQTLTLIESMPLKELGARMQLVALLRSLLARRQSPGFRLAIVGEFSRGKSYLINRLLGREELLPVSAAPTAAILTSIVAGTKEQMIISFAPDSQEVRSLSPAAWDDLLATQESADEREISTHVRITLDDPWLRSLDVELIDTPGAGDLNQHRAAAVFDLLSQCDAAVLVVSATSPFSLTEAAFLEQEAIGRHIPRVLAVVTKLDTIALAERESVLATIQARISKISPAIAVLPSHSVADYITEAKVLSNLKTEIAHLVDRGERRQWRDRQIASQLTDCLHQIQKIGETAIASIRFSHPERQQAFRQAQMQLRQADLNWENLRLELEHRRLRGECTLQHKILQAKTQLLEVLKLELSQAAQPKIWWERDLPMRLRRELITLAGKSEHFLSEAIARDFNWLHSEIARIFSLPIPDRDTPSWEQLEMRLALAQLNLTDTGRDRLFTRMGSSAAAVCGYILAGPVGIVLSTSVWLVGERILNRQAQTQRQLLAEELQRSINSAFENYSTTACDRLRQLYNDLAQEIYKQQSAWQSTINTALATGGNEDERAWQQLIDQVTKLSREIHH
jgi:GTPase Era involved in 16S rRNA processing